jgi:hypothetical protein
VAQSRVTVRRFVTSIVAACCGVMMDSVLTMFTSEK